MMSPLRLAVVLAALCISPAVPSQEPQKYPASEKKCTSNAGCDTKEFCNTYPNCGPDATGTCKKRPAICTQDSFPAMGCDGKTYANACRTHAAGMTIKGSR